MTRDQKLHKDIHETIDAMGFDRNNLGPRIRKLGEELGEMHEALMIGSARHIYEEIADVAIVLSDILYLVSHGHCYKEMTLLEVMEMKWAKNKEKWATNNREQEKSS